MPSRAKRPCTKAGCTAYATKKGRCDNHQPKQWDHKGKTAHQRGYGSDWRKTRSRVLKRDGHLCKCDDCVMDGIYLPATEVDHIIPKSRGGDDSLANLRAMNTECHKKKSVKEAIYGLTGDSR